MNLRKLLYILLACFIITSCDSLINSLQNNEQQNTSAPVEINISFNKQESGRKAVPTYTKNSKNIYETECFYELKIIDEAGIEFYSTNGLDYIGFSEFSTNLLVGHKYTFNVTGSLGGNKILTGTTEYTVVNKDNKVSVHLVGVEGATGTLEYSIITSGDDSYCKFYLYKMEDFITKGSSATVISSETYTLEEDEEFYKFNKTLPEGTYYLSCYGFYFDDLIFTYGEEIVIQAGLTTTKTSLYREDYFRFHLNGGKLTEKLQNFYKDFITPTNDKDIVKIFLTDIEIGDDNCPLVDLLTFHDSEYYLLPEKEGYIFAGWYYDSDFEASISRTDNTFYTGNKDAYAKWVEPSNPLANMTLPIYEIPEYGYGNFYYTNNLFHPYNSNLKLVCSSAVNEGNYCLSPDAKKIIYASDKNVYTLDSSEDEPTPLFSVELPYAQNAITCPTDNRIFTAYIAQPGISYCTIDLNAEPPSLLVVTTITESESIEYVKLAVDTQNNVLYSLTTLYSGSTFINNYTIKLSAIPYFITDGALNVDETAIVTTTVTTTKADEYDKDNSSIILKGTDIKLSNGNIYLTTNVRTGNDTLPSFYSFGEVYKYTYNNGKLEGNSIRTVDKKKPVLTGTGDGKDHNIFDVYSSKTKSDKNVLYGAQKILAITEKKLVLADSGIYVYSDNDYLHSSKKQNRVVIIDLESEIIEYTENVGYDFDSDPYFSNFFLAN